MKKKKKVIAINIFVEKNSIKICVQLSGMLSFPAHLWSIDVGWLRSSTTLSYNGQYLKLDHGNMF